MKDLIKALTILSKYLEEHHVNYPTYCEHDVLYVCVDYTKIPEEEIFELQELGFYRDEDTGYMISYRYGSC